MARSTSDTRRRRLVAGLLVAAAVSATGVGPGPTGAPARPAGAVTATLRSLRTVDVALASYNVAAGSSEYFSSPALADLNGDDKPELVVAAPSGTVTATRIQDGARLWQRPLGATAIQASPLVTDVEGDGRVDVVAATMDGRVVLLDGQDGTVRRTFRQGAPLHCPVGQDCRPDGFFATPVVADVNGDGRNDIVAASFDHTLYAWSHGGTLLWRSYLYDTLWSSPTVADIDRDGRLEVVVGGDIYADNPLGVPAGGLLWAVRGASGATMSGYPRSLPGQTAWSSPSIADLDGDGRVEAVIGSGTHGPFGDGAAARRVWAITLADRRDLAGWPITATGRVVGNPAVGDVDGDGRTDVVFGSENGYVEAWSHTGVRKWATCNAGLVTACNGSAVGHGGAVIADVDDDGLQEVVSALSQYLRIYDGRDRTLEAEYRLTGNSTLNPPSVAAISEIGGRTVIAQSSIYRVDHSGPPRAGDVVRTNLLTTDRRLCAEDWPGFKGDARRRSTRPARPPWHPFGCGRPFVAQQYRDLLGRAIDDAGSSFWTARLRGTWSGARVVEGFMDSAEFGAVAAPVVRLHLGLKGGPPLPATEVRGQMADLRGGVALATVADRLLAQGPWAAESDDQLVSRVFPHLTDRAPTAAERAAAVNRISAAGRGAWLAELASTATAVSRQADRVQVAMTYIGLLNRGPDTSGWAYWVAAVGGGTSPQRLIEQFLASSEYRGRVL